MILWHDNAGPVKGNGRWSRFLTVVLWCAGFINGAVFFECVRRQMWQQALEAALLIVLFIVCLVWQRNQAARQPERWVACSECNRAVRLRDICIAGDRGDDMRIYCQTCRADRGVT